MGSGAPVDYDVVIVGAGISGINMAYRLQERNPNLSYCIIEGRSEMGGTWSLFKYPGIRSDSDLFTFGFPWRPWVEKKSIAHGSLILNYLRESAESAGIDKNIKFNHKVAGMDWSSKDKRWTLDVTRDEKTQVDITANFIFFGTGYYNYEEPLETIIPGIEKFGGQVIHPQFWPEDLDYEGKNVVVIGSGATAVTLLPSMGEKAAHVTMLQRSPSYVLSIPATDPFDRLVRFLLPGMIAHTIIRAKWTLQAFLFITFCRRLPSIARWILLHRTARELPKDVAMDPNFIPSYNPWQQRMCLCPDADFYKCLQTGKCSIVTDTIKTMTKKSIKLNSGKELQPDIIITATGLKLRALGGINVSVDSENYVIGDHFAWKGCMLEGLPNAALAFGYTDASWTLGADATAQLVSRMLNKMAENNIRVVTPERTVEEVKNMPSHPFLNLNSTYVKKGGSGLPKAGTNQWAARSFWYKDIFGAWYGDITSNINWQ